MEILIRKATEEDKQSIIVLWKELFLFHEPFDEFFETREDAESKWSSFLTTIIDRQKEDSACVFIAEVQSTKSIVGYILGVIEKNVPVFKMEEVGNIYDICVTDKYRRLNVGMKLVNEIKKWYTSNGINRIHVQVASKNPLSTSFWRKMGFITFMEKMYIKI